MGNLLSKNQQLVENLSPGTSYPTKTGHPTTTIPSGIHTYPSTPSPSPTPFVLPPLPPVVKSPPISYTFPATGTLPAIVYTGLIDVPVSGPATSPSSSTNLSQLEILQTQFRSQNSLYVGQIKQYNATIGTLNQYITSYQTDINNTKSQIVSNNSNIAANNQNITYTNQSITNINVDIHNITVNENAENSQITSNIASQIAALNVQLNALKTEQTNENTSYNPIQTQIYNTENTCHTENYQCDPDNHTICTGTFWGGSNCWTEISYGTCVKQVCNSITPSEQAAENTYNTNNTNYNLQINNLNQQITDLNNQQTSELSLINTIDTDELNVLNGLLQPLQERLALLNKSYNKLLSTSKPMILSFLETRENVVVVIAVPTIFVAVIVVGVLSVNILRLFTPILPSLT